MFVLTKLCWFLTLQFIFISSWLCVAKTKTTTSTLISPLNYNFNRNNLSDLILSQQQIILSRGEREKRNVLRNFFSSTSNPLLYLNDDNYNCHDKSQNYSSHQIIVPISSHQTCAHQKDWPTADLTKVDQKDREKPRKVDWPDVGQESDQPADNQTDNLLSSFIQSNSSQNFHDSITIMMNSIENSFDFINQLIYDQINGFDSNNNQLSIWLLAIASALLVGVSSMFPLIFISITNFQLCFDDKDMHNPGSTNYDGVKSLKYLLSFAVGGLLGDVFLHLIPEAWNQISKSGVPVHQVQKFMGFWILIGIFTFSLMEMVFNQSKDGPEDSRVKNKSTSSSSLSSSSHSSSKSSSFKSSSSSSRSKSSQNGRVNHPKKDNNLNHTNPYNHKNNYNNKNNNHLANGNGANVILNNHVNGNCYGDNEGGVYNHSSDKSGGDKPSGSNGDACDKSNFITGYLNLLANAFDNFTHGLAVGASFMVSFRMGMLTTFAIVIHEIPHEIGDFAILLRSGFTKWEAVRAQVSIALMTVLGAIVALWAQSAQFIGVKTAWILPFTAGGFLHIALVSLLPEIMTQNQNIGQSMRQALCIAMGITAMSLVNMIPE